MSAVSHRLRHFTRLLDLRRDELLRLLALAEELRADPTLHLRALEGRSVACIFDVPSPSTRASFSAATARLGAMPIALSSPEPKLGGESIADTARALSGYVDAIVVQALAQATVHEFARWSTVPVVNALSDTHHPCQALADLLTIRDAFSDLPGRRVAFLGDGAANVAHSLVEACALAEIDLTIACPPGYGPDPDVLHLARSAAGESGTELQVVRDPRAAVAGAHAVYADVWGSMGAGAEYDARHLALAPYQVTEELMTRAQPGAIFMHCLPVARNEEVAADVVDGPQSVVWQQSANRLPTEEALLLMLTGRD